MTRKLELVDCHAFRSGTTRGRDWTIYKIYAIDEDGVQTKDDLVSFEPLEVDGKLRDYDLEMKSRELKGKTYVSYNVKLAKVKDTPAPPLVPDGRYAVQGVNGNWTLLRVWRGTRNPTIQHVYVVKGTEKGERLGRVEERLAAIAIARDPGQAAIDFGHRTGSCSRCGKELEVNLSRKLGIGPDCMKHWFTDQERHSKKAAARSELRADGIDPSDKHDLVAA